MEKAVPCDSGPGNHLAPAIGMLVKSETAPRMCEHRSNSETILSICALGISWPILRVASLSRSACVQGWCSLRGAIMNCTSLPAGLVMATRSFPSYEERSRFFEISISGLSQYLAKQQLAVSTLLLLPPTSTVSNDLIFRSDRLALPKLLPSYVFSARTYISSMIAPLPSIRRINVPSVSPLSRTSSTMVTLSPD